jgi:RimJ/RimL family protein N-acetyltransferase
MCRSRAWPGAELTVIGDSAHLGSGIMTESIRAALDRFATPRA